MAEMSPVQGFTATAVYDGARILGGGSAANPALVYDGSLTTGYYQTGADELAMAIAGAEAVRLNASQFIIQNTHAMGYEETTPAQIVGNVNDYNPGPGQFFRISTSAVWDITGIAGGGTNRTILFTNVGAFNFTLKHQDVASAAANRIITCTALDEIIAPGESAMLIYDNTSSRWRVYAGAGAAGALLWQDTAGVINLTTAGNTVTIGSAVAGGKLFIDGDADEIQLQIQGTAGQTAALLLLENSGGTDLAQFSAAGWLGIGVAPTEMMEIQANVNAEITSKIRNINAGAAAMTTFDVEGDTAGITIRADSSTYGPGVFASLSRSDSVSVTSQLTLPVSRMFVGTLAANDLHLITDGAAVGNYAALTILGSDQNVGIHQVNPTAQIWVTNDVVTEPVAVLQQVAAQTADSLQVQNSAGTILAWINDNGYIISGDYAGAVGNHNIEGAAPGIGHYTNVLSSQSYAGNSSARMGSRAVGSTEILMVAYTATSTTTFLGHTTADAVSIETFDVASIRPALMLIGNRTAIPICIGTNDTTHITMAADGDLGLNEATPLAQVHVLNDTAGDVVMILQQAAAQTGDSFQVQNNAGTVLALIDDDGAAVFKGNALYDAQSDTTVWGNRMDLVSDANVSAFFRAVSYSDDNTKSPGVYGWKARGTYAVPAAVQTGDNLVGFIGIGHDGTSFDSTNPRGSIILEATENWGLAAKGTQWAFRTTQTGTLNTNLAMTIQQDQLLLLEQALQMKEHAAHPGTTVAGQGILWVRNDSPCVLVFTDDTNVDTVLGAGGGGVTLNGAYDFGGAGAGRTITVDSGAVFLDGGADNIVLHLQGHSTQTSEIFLIEQSDGTDLLRMYNTCIFQLTNDGDTAITPTVYLTNMSNSATIDPQIRFQDGAVPADRWTMGLDTTDDSFKIEDGGGLGSATGGIFSMLYTGSALRFGFGIATPASTFGDFRRDSVGMMEIRNQNADATAGSGAQWTAYSNTASIRMMAYSNTTVATWGGVSLADACEISDRAQAATKMFIGTGGSSSVLLLANSTVRMEMDATGLAFNGQTPIARPDYTITNLNVDRVLDCDATTLDEVADVLGTLITDLISYGLLQ